MAAAKRKMIDLDKARAARAEAEREPVALKIGGETFELPAEIPADYSLLLTAGDVRGALEALFGTERPSDEEPSQAEKFFEQRPSVQDLNELIDQIESAYAVDQGK